MNAGAQDGREAVAIRIRSNSPKKEGGAWCWQNKAALERISRGSDFEAVQSRLAIYTVLTWIASDRKSETASFTTFVAEIARRAGASKSGTRAALRDLEAAGLITVEHHREGKLNTASTYNIVSLSPPRKGAPTVGEPCANEKRRGAPQNRATFLAPSEEEEREGAPLPADAPVSLTKKDSKPSSSARRPRSRSLGAARRAVGVESAEGDYRTSGGLTDEDRSEMLAAMKEGSLV